ncbi:MAG TPA: RNA polymerase sigma factor [Pyrinomonadaceae bacterium]|nr:RNA polymerase sigma factor [Pyrinomonadaceae bacterium]
MAPLMEISEVKAELEKHHSSGFGWALSCCGRDPSEAEEVLQLVYLKILDGRARYGGESSFKTWLFAVIRKTAASERRKNFLRKLILNAGAERVPRASRTEDPALALERSETHARFRHALAQLPARQQQTLHLVFYEDLSLQETADTIGISVGAVRKHYGRAKASLRDLLLESEGNYGIEWRRQKNPSVVL